MSQYITNKKSQLMHIWKDMWMINKPRKNQVQNPGTFFRGISVQTSAVGVQNYTNSCSPTRKANECEILLYVAFALSQKTLY